MKAQDFHIDTDTFMDEALGLCNVGRTLEGMDLLVQGLRVKRQSSSSSEWKAWVGSAALNHPIKRIAHSCDFTHHAFSKPRGYAGDAALIDRIYDYMSSEGGDVNVSTYTLMAPAPTAVRFRRFVLAQRIDEALRARPHARILSVACGHLRELEISTAARSGALRNFIAMDQDEQSIGFVQERFGKLGIQAEMGSVRDLISGKLRFSDLSLIYAAGLFDYLSDSAARRLTEVLFGSLREGGRLLVANFHPDISDAGYMESFMDWHLTYRTEPEMLQLVEGLQTISIPVSYMDPGRNIVFVELVKRTL